MNAPEVIPLAAARRVGTEVLLEHAALYHSHAGALEQLATDGLGDAEAYRTLAREALAMLHDAGRREQQLRQQLAALRDELRRYTAAQVGREAA